jgi:O-antigen/teichoic acid export membrane protein
MTLVVRTAVLQLLIFGGNLVLARILDPRDFGVFAISQFALTFFVYFGDAGLAGALVQQHDTPSQTKLSSVLWLQLGISAVVIAVVWVAAPLSHFLWRDLPVGSEWLLRALSFELLLTAARTVPSLLMERELQFGRLSVLEVTNQLAFYVAALPLGLLGYGVWALVVGVLTRAIVGVVLAYSLRPWRPRAVMRWDELRPIVAFGIPYQAKNLVGFVSNALIPVYAGHALGVRAVGLLGWSRTTAITPLRIVEIVSRVGFPLYSRLQDDPRALGNALGKSIHVCATGTFVFVGLIYGLGPEIIHIAYPKWTDALVLLYMFTGSMTVGFLTPVIASAFDAIGRPQVFLRLAIGWTLLGWALVPFLTPRWGIVGFAVGFIAQIVAGNATAIALVQTEFPTARPLGRLRGVAVALVVQVALGRLVLAPHVTGWTSLVLSVLASAACFAGVVVAIDRQALLDAVAMIRRTREAPASP